LETSLPSREVKIYGEEMNLEFLRERHSFSIRRKIASCRTTKKVSAATSVGDSAGVHWPRCRPVVDVGQGAKVAVAESDVEEYPGLWLRGTGGPGLAATFPPYPLQEKPGE